MCTHRKVMENRQSVYMGVTNNESNVKFRVTFVYPSNSSLEINGLWVKLRNIKRQSEDPWMVIGDLNNVLFSFERVGGDLVHPRETMVLANCVEDTKVIDLKVVGAFYTWSNGRFDNRRIWSQIDRCMVNLGWVSCRRAQLIFVSRELISLTGIGGVDKKSKEEPTIPFQ